MKKLVSILTSGFIFLGFPTISLAAVQTGLDPCQGSSSSFFHTLCSLGQGTNAATSVGGVLGSVITMMFVIAAIIALWFLVQGGIRWITSQGDTKNVEGARNQIIAAAVGLAVTFLSYLIINLLLQFFIGHTLQDIKIPTLGS